ncbi:ABC transporter substrate-binding protein [Fusobacterium sp. PH5-44]|uniref:ABC transporter substrate-binding protein n=1 Tax=unclassified Fusobacterium TaxID=2648384 RepID=UPI003D22B2F0
MKKIKLLLSVMVLSWQFSTMAVEEKKFNIGITQITEHPSLDLARKGFKDALEDKKILNKIVIDVKNAQGDFATSQMIAKGFVDSKKDLIFAISTPSAQTVYNVTKDIPIVITAVTDPVAAGLTGKNITGTSDPMPIREQIELIKVVLPTVKTIGLIYNTSEQNSVISIGNIKSECDKVGLKYVEVGVTSVNEIVPAMENLLEKVDMVFLTTDNLISSSATLVIELANKKNVPVLAGDAGHMPLGALMTKTIDFYQIGYRAGEMAVEVLEGKNPSDMPIEPPKVNQVLINKKMAEKYGIDLKLKIFENAKITE